MLAIVTSRTALRSVIRPKLANHLGRRQRQSLTMGKKKIQGEYNDFIDGEKLRDNAGIRPTWNASSSEPPRNTSSPPPNPQPDQQRRGSSSKSQNPQKKPQLTHFICFPLVTPANRPDLQQGLTKLKEEVESTNLVSPKAVRPLGTLHMTLGVMSLNATQLSLAQQYLQDLDLHRLLRDATMQSLAEKAASDGTVSENLCAASMPDTSAVVVDLKGLKAMQKPERTSVLYAYPLEQTGRLQAFGEAIKRCFMDEGLVLDEKRDLILHATVINTLYAKPKGGAAGARGKGRSSKEWMNFDARGLIEEYEDFVWAEGVRIDRVQILKMGARKIWSGGEEGVGEIVDEEYEVVGEKRIGE